MKYARTEMKSVKSKSGKVPAPVTEDFHHPIQYGLPPSGIQNPEQGNGGLPTVRTYVVQYSVYTASPTHTHSSLNCDLQFSLRLGSGARAERYKLYWCDDFDGAMYCEALRVQ